MEFLNRFCFVLDKVENCNELKILLKQLDASLTVELYERNSVLFMVVDVATQHNVYAFKNNLIKQLNTILEKVNATSLVELERIFKKVPEEVYVTNRVDNYLRTVMTLELVNDPELLKDYIEAHSPEKMWPEILKNMDSIGVKNMELYINQYQAFLLMDTQPDFDFKKEGAVWAELPREKEWQQFVAKYQKVDPHSNAAQKWQIMSISTN